MNSLFRVNYVQRRPEAFGEPGAKHQFEAKMTKLQGIGP